MSKYDYCRLCSATKNLISMFSGKSRAMRESLRKMIQLTVDVQIEHCDAVVSVCFNCLVDVTNFYYFKLNCLDNQRNLKARAGSFSTSKKCKVDFKYLENILSPDIELAQQVLDWLKSKRKILGPPPSESKIFTEKASQTFVESCDVVTQSEIIHTISNGSQTDDDRLSKSLSDNGSQTFLEKFNVSTQSEAGFQIDSDKSKSCEKQEKSTQTKKSNNSCDTKNNVPKIKTKNSYSQTNGPKKTFKNCYSQTSSPQKNFNNCYSQTDAKDLSIEVTSQESCTKSKLPKTVGNGQNHQAKTTEVTTHASVLEKNCQTESAQMKTVSTQFDLAHIFNGLYSKHFLSPSTHSHSKEIDSKLNIKLSFKEEKLSPLECLTISTTPKKYEPVSPNFSGLLQVKSKSECVNICKICDQCLYSKKEILIHKKTHMVCRFCKMKFRSLKSTQSHVQVCQVKEMNILPFVNLVKIDDQPSVVEQYPTAFNGSNNCL